MQKDHTLLPCRPGRLRNTNSRLRRSNCRRSASSRRVVHRHARSRVRPKSVAPLSAISLLLC
jgi:hypothetical protein